MPVNGFSRNASKGKELAFSFAIEGKQYSLYRRGVPKFEVTKRNVAKTVEDGRKRWRIENEG